MVPHIYYRSLTIKKNLNSFGNGRSKWVTDSRSALLIARSFVDAHLRERETIEDRVSPPLSRSCPRLAVLVAYLIVCRDRVSTPRACPKSPPWTTSSQATLSPHQPKVITAANSALSEDGDHAGDVLAKLINEVQ
jgi:hypothetical protein